MRTSAGFFMAAKRNAPKRGVGPAMLSLGRLFFVKKVALK
jgi:hypothetical protein